MIRGKVIKFGDNIDTDQVIAGEYLSLPTIEAMKPYVFKNHKNFIDNYKEGDILVASSNFGCGSSREQAPASLKNLKVGAIIAKDYARIFYRNAINLGLPVIECADVDKIKEFDQLEILLAEGKIINKTQKTEYRIETIPEFMLSILNSGGIVEYKKRKKS